MIEIKQADFMVDSDCRAFLTLLDAYSRDPMGAGQPLAQDVRERICDDLAAFAGAVSFIAWADGTQPVGLINGFLGYSTFKGRPLMNIHDIVVLQHMRGQGVAKALMQAIETHAISKGCCKLTLEVLSGNGPARQAYLNCGFEDYALDPAAGTAMFMQKWL